jgi:hypothetical protein
VRRNENSVLVVALASSRHCCFPDAAKMAALRDIRAKRLVGTALADFPIFVIFLDLSPKERFLLRLELVSVLYFQ